MMMMMMMTSMEIIVKSEGRGGLKHKSSENNQITKVILIIFCLPKMGSGRAGPGNSAPTKSLMQSQRGMRSPENDVLIDYSLLLLPGERGAGGRVGPLDRYNKLSNKFPSTL